MRKVRVPLYVMLCYVMSYPPLTLGEVGRGLPLFNQHKSGKRTGSRISPNTLLQLTGESWQPPTILFAMIRHDIVRNNPAVTSKEFTGRRRGQLTGYLLQTIYC